MSADYLVRDGIAVITLNNPPVNGLGLATRTAAWEGLRRAAAAADVAAIVLAGAGNTFSGGADIREFNSPKALTEPTLFTLIATAEASPKPVVAALHGVCMGGGLELALGCHYRVAAAGTKLALPEVKLGLLPGAGGTQRLPRALGLEAALAMIVSGDPVAAEQLAGTPLLDALLPAGADMVEQAVAFARRVATARPLPTIGARAVAIEDPDAYFAAVRARVAAQAGPYPAPLACVDALEAAVRLPLADGLAYERQRFMALMASPESTALRHAFFAERAAGKVADLAPATPVRPVRRAAVVGAGTMGAGIAICLADAGLGVTVLERSQERLERGLAAIRAHYDGSVAKGRMARDKADARLAAVRGTLVAADLAQTDLVIEAVVEDLGVKQAVFRELDGVLRPGAILATNTSTLLIDRLAAATSRPQDVLGLHFFSPAPVMKLLEIVRGARTAPDVLVTAIGLAKSLRKTGVVAGDGDGFIGNRMLEPYLRQAGFLLDEGALPAQVDRAIEAFGFAMGPFRMSDLAGNDVGWAIRRRRAAEDPVYVYSTTADRLCELGRFGQKTGAGWYDYVPGERAARPSAVVDDMVVRHSAEIGISRRAIGDDEIVERLVYALVNEGARLLEERVAQRASDIDIVYLTGYGFPRWRGGPMFYADTVGLPRVVEAIERFARGYQGQAWAPAPLLVRLAAEGRGFNG
jgi:3-hydroxyacyl-CoA dehydrogenase